MFSACVPPGGEVHAKHHLAATLHAFQWSWLWESDRHGFVADFEICLLLWMLSTTASSATLCALEGIDDAAKEGLEPVLKPLMSFTSEWPVGSSASGRRR